MEAWKQQSLVSAQMAPRIYGASVYAESVAIAPPLQNDGNDKSQMIMDQTLAQKLALEDWQAQRGAQPEDEPMDQEFNAARACFVGAPRNTVSLPNHLEKGS